MSTSAFGQPSPQRRPARDSDDDDGFTLNPVIRRRNTLPAQSSPPSTSAIRRAGHQQLAGSAPRFALGGEGVHDSVISSTFSSDPRTGRGPPTLADAHSGPRVPAWPGGDDSCMVIARLPSDEVFGGSPATSGGDGTVVLGRQDLGLFTPSDRYIHEFDEFEDLGHGDFGCVSAARSIADRQRYAIKRTLRTVEGTVASQHVLQEVYALSSASSRHVLRYFDAWFDSSHQLCIATELVRGGSIAQQIGTPEFTQHRFMEIWHIALQAGLGLHALHSTNIAHLDIKPDNLLCETEDGTGRRIIKIGDFGLARPLNLDATSTSGFLGLNDDEGDARYLSPELLQSPDTPFLKEADVYALGMTLLELATGENPRHVSRTGDFGCLAPLPDALSALIRAMTSPSPDQRPTAFDVVLDASRELIRVGGIECAESTMDDLRAKVDVVRRLQQEVQQLELTQGHTLDNLPPVGPAPAWSNDGGLAGSYRP